MRPVYVLIMIRFLYCLYLSSTSEKTDVPMYNRVYSFFWMYYVNILNPTGLFLYPLESSENQRTSYSKAKRWGATTRCYWYLKKELFIWNYKTLSLSFLRITTIIIGNLLWFKTIDHFNCFIARTLLWRRCLTYRNQSIDLLYNSMDWFLDDRDLCHERINLLMIWLWSKY